MLMLLSPAKTLDYTTPPVTSDFSLPDFLDHSTQLIALLKQQSPAQIASLMKLSDPLAALNVGRYQAWHPNFTPSNAKQAVLAFMGDVYEGLNAGEMNQTQLDYLSKHLRILSGLYGLLRPLDLIQPYRLEMGTSLANPAGNHLYAFWGETITKAINQLEPKVVVNLASTEYFKSVKPKLLNSPLITPVFEDYKNGKYKIISFYAKRARGLMVRWAASHNINQAEYLKAFNSEGYQFTPSVSNGMSWVFRRNIE
ncbi:peroxide stress protein YaaA [Iodobacter sp. CM08]|uniref:peroxide stress protein YaaA n=1 Tax=Iodobacter sp. CM08 TaxID=3085902 RepID=UPI0029823203|nr:peroxide stress protein YaaA [Iodobacter sp. CM08]MDW5417209.1 peroxide stress protein YaaA [Iodobacter sp. CM08]